VSGIHVHNLQLLRNPRGGSGHLRGTYSMQSLIATPSIQLVQLVLHLSHTPTGPGRKERPDPLLLTPLGKDDAAHG